MRISQMTKKQPNAQPAKQNLACPCRGGGIDLYDRIVQAAVEEVHIEDIPNLAQRIQRIHKFPECS
jgi:hypothetical protein